MNRMWYAALMLLLIVRVPPAHAETSKLDPRIRIALDQLRAGASLAQLRANATPVSATGDLDVFIVGSATRAELEAAGARVRTEAGGVFTAYVPPKAVEVIAGLPGVRAIVGAVPVTPGLDLSVPTTHANALRGAGPDFTGLSGAGVLIGAVDLGVDYHHEDFDDPAGNTRIVNIWDQNDAVGPSPAGYAYGTEWTSADIDANLVRQVDTGAHGTAVLGVAAGDGSATGGSVPAFTYVGMAPKSDLLAVIWKVDASYTTHVVDGVNYIFQRAAARGQNSVANLSVGTAYYGPHDGSSPWETALSALSGPGRIVVSCAGNLRTSAMHAEVFAAGAGTDATMDLGGASGSVSQVSIDGYYNSTENVRVSVLTPGGTPVGPVLRGTRNAAYPGQLTPDGYVYIDNGIAQSSRGDREVYLVINANLAASPRTWTYRFTPVTLGPANGEVDLWCLPTSGSTAVFVTGRQDEELLWEPANSDSVITVASWTTKRYWTDCNGTVQSFATSVDPGNISEFSSPGPTRDGRQKPDIAAPGSAIGTALSQDIGPTCNPYRLPDGLQHGMMWGTSFSAPHVAGAAALILQKYGAVSPSFVKQFLASRAVVDGYTGSVWNKDWGAGKLWLGDMLDPAVAAVLPDGGERLLVGSPSTLRWTATDNVGVASVDVLLSRTGSGGPFDVLASGVTGSGAIDWTVTGPPSSDCRLKVVARDAMGNLGERISANPFTITIDPTSVDAPAVLAFALHGARPNPSTGRLTASFTLPDARRATLELFDATGRRITAREVGSLGAGHHVIDLTLGQSSPAGVYLLRLTQGEQTLAAKAAFMR